MSTEHESSSPSSLFRPERAAVSWDRHNELLDRVDEQVGRIQDSDAFRAYLDVQATFHRYSFGNVALIMAQCPDATRVAGYKTWRALGRQVRKGERAIRIIVPLPARVRDDDDDEAQVRLRFGVGNVFDIGQTDGAPLPDVAVPVLEGDDGGMLYDDLARMAHGEGIRVDRSAALSPDSAMGFYQPVTRRIVVREAAQLQMTKTLAHELAHHFTGMHETYDTRRAAHETIAEATAYVVLAHFGLDSGARSFPYIATWAKDRTTLKAVLGTIQGVTNTVVTRIEARYGLPLALPTDDASRDTSSV